MNYKLDTVVRFYISTGYMNCDDSEEFTLSELGFNQRELDDLTNEKIEKEIDECFGQWLTNYDVGWGVVE